MAKKRNPANEIIVAIIGGIFVVIAALIGGVFLLANTLLDKKIDNGSEASKFEGIWVVEHDGTPVDLCEVQITSKSSRILVHAWACGSPDWIDYGVTESEIKGTKAIIYYSYSGMEMQITLDLISPNRLRITNSRHFPNSPGDDYLSENTFLRTNKATVTPVSKITP